MSISEVRMPLNRRNLIASATAVAVTPFAATKAAFASDPALAEALHPALHPGAYQLLMNVLAETRYHENAAGQQLTRIILGVTMRILQNHPDTFDLDHVMRGPVDQFTHGGQTYAVEAKTRKYAARWTFESPLPEDTPDLEGVLLDTLAEDLALEIKGERNHPDNRGLVMCPYIAVTSSGVIIEPLHYLPIVSFMIRYGTFKPSESAVS